MERKLRERKLGENLIENIKTAKEDIMSRQDLEMLKKVIGQDKKKWRKFEKEAFTVWKKHF